MWKYSLHGILPRELVGSDNTDKQEHNPEEGDKRHLFDPCLIESCSMAIDPESTGFQEIQDKHEMLLFNLEWYRLGEKKYPSWPRLMHY
jgi:hypothetical protein